MSQDRSVPKTYDEIVRGTVPDLDSSRRPTAAQEQLAREGHRHIDEHETAIAAHIRVALGDLPGVEVEIERDTVTLRGNVADVAKIAQAEDIVGHIDGVARVINHLVVGL